MIQYECYIIVLIKQLFFFFVQVEIRTNRGLREAYIQKMDQDTLAEGIKVVIKRKGEIYEEGVVRYFGYLTGELVIGIELAKQSENSSVITVLYYSIITVLYYSILQYFTYLIYFIIELLLGTDSQGMNNDGIYKDNKRYFRWLVS